MLEISTISQFFQFSGDKTNQTKPRSSFGISAIFLCVLGVKSPSGFTWVCVYQNLSSDIWFSSEQGIQDLCIPGEQKSCLEKISGFHQDKEYRIYDPQDPA